MLSKGKLLLVINIVLSRYKDLRFVFWEEKKNKKKEKRKTKPNEKTNQTVST